MPLRSSLPLAVVLLLAPATALAAPAGSVEYRDANAPIEALETREALADTPDGRARLIRSLLKKARVAVDEKRLMTPENDSALYYYELVLAIDPWNDEARSGRRALGREYIALAERAWKLGNRARAAEYLDRAELFVPNTPELDLARRRLAAPAPGPNTTRRASVRGGTAPGGERYPTIRAAKIAYLLGEIDRREYRRIARLYSEEIRREQRRLKALYRDGQLSKREYRRRARNVELRLEG